MLPSMCRGRTHDKGSMDGCRDPAVQPRTLHMSLTQAQSMYLLGISMRRCRMVLQGRHRRHGNPLGSGNMPLIPQVSSTRRGSPYTPCWLRLVPWQSLRQPYLQGMVCTM